MSCDYCDSFLVDLGNLNHGVPDLGLTDERVHNCLIGSSNWSLSDAAYHVVMKMEPQSDVERISAVIQSHIPDATLEKYAGAELSFILPRQYTHRYRFREFYNDGSGDQKSFSIFQV